MHACSLLRPLLVLAFAPQNTPPSCDIYLGKDIKKGRDVAVKLEVALEWGGSRLKHEYNVYRAILGICGISKMLWYGMEG